MSNLSGTGFTSSKQSSGGGGGSGSTLSGADREFASAVTSGDGSTTAKTITAAPAGDILLLVNGQEELIGDAVLTEEAYFSDDGGTTPKAIASILAGDTLYWNGVVAGYELAAADRLRLVYET